MQTSEQKIRVWRMRAEEYRTAADNSKYQDTKQVYRSLARSYELLAEREERNVKAEAEKSPRPPASDKGRAS